MNLIFRILFLFVIFCASFFASAFGATRETEAKPFLKEGVVLSSPYEQYDIINDEESIQNAQIITENLSKNQKQTSINAKNKTENSQFTKLLSYIYLKSYLENKNKNSLALLLGNINPNAP